MTDIVTDALSKSNTSFELQLIIDSEKQKIRERKQREIDRQRQKLRQQAKEIPQFHAISIARPLAAQQKLMKQNSLFDQQSRSMSRNSIKERSKIYSALLSVKKEEPREQSIRGMSRQIVRPSSKL